MSARTAIRSGAALAVTAAVLLLAACGMGQPGQTATPSPSVSTAAPTETPSATPAPSATPSPGETSAPPQAEADIELPGACEQIYSPAMLASLEAANPPLNDPELSLFSTGIEAVYDVLQSGIPTLRCTWGVPSEVGLATTVAIIDEQQREFLEQTLEANSLTCSDYEGGRICRIVIEYPEDDMNLGHTSGETHYLQGNGWIATSWINFGPEGYTEDIVNSLWG